MKTAVEWLYENLLDNPISNEDVIYNINIFEQAKEMEIEQSHKYAEFAIRCDREDMKILNFDGYMNLETFKSE
jgi:hypothetical protein